jgi:hypothetical protein
MPSSTSVGIWQSTRRSIRRLLTPRAHESDGAATAAGSTPTVPPVFVPPGHFYSPIPSQSDVEAFARRTAQPLAGVDLDEPGQLAVLDALAAFYPSMPFTSEGSSDLRYRFENESYSYADGTFLHTMLRHLRPKRLIEVGSGYTSALTLDTNERFLDGKIECVFVEPYPALLFSLMTESDRRRHRVIQAGLQDVDLTLFDSLEAGDVLFIDSTHVSKVNSDVNRLFFEILPRLAPGTIVHIHDVFPGFEYPLEWLLQGRAWNEQYVLHAFLQFNSAFKIRLFGHHMIQRHPEWFRAHMPLCLKNPGGAFWMERVR